MLFLLITFSSIYCCVNNFWNRIFEYSELKCLISVASKITDICQNFGSLAIITESDFTKLKNFVKYYQDEISNFRYVKFFKIAAGSAHVWSRHRIVSPLLQTKRICTIHIPLKSLHNLCLKKVKLLQIACFWIENDSKKKF